MFKNYLLIAARNLTKNIGYTSINVFGLAIGLACCFLVTLYIGYELSFENFHQNKQSIYRYIPRSERDGAVNMQTYLPAGFGPFVKEHFREIKAYTRFTVADQRPLLVFNNQTLEAKPLALADEDFFRMFSFRLIAGEADQVLSRPFTVAIAQSVAAKFFPGGNALGQVIRYDNAFDLEVTGVFEDVPANSHLQFTYISTFPTAAKIVEQRYGVKADAFLNDMGAWNYSCYFHIPGASNIDFLEKEIDKKFTEARKETFNEAGLGDWLQPLDKIHFTKGIRGDTANGDRNYIVIFSAVAFMILLIACFNFTNLSTARALKRAKEVGLRKVMGAFRSQLIKQFLGETLILVGIAMLFSVILLELMIPLFNGLMGLNLGFNYFGEGSFLWIFVSAGILTGILAGGYPAFYLSSFAPAKVLKGQTGPAGNASLRKILTVLQFSVATFLLIGTLVVFLQMKFVQDTNLGFQQERIIYFAPPDALWNRINTFKQNLLAHSEVESVTLSNGTPGMENSTWRYQFPGLDVEERSFNTMIVDFDFVKTFDLQIVQGRNISPEFATDSTQAYLINETAARELLLENPVGTSIQTTNGKPAGKIVGVIKDFHYRSLHRQIEPLILRMDPNNMWCMSVRFVPGNLTQQLAVVEQEWKKIAPGYPFTYEFVDDTVGKQYKAEQSTSVLLTSFTLLAIIIACLGLIGLTAFMTEQRKKEIGIRKVLGATVSNVVLLLSKDFSKLVVIGFLIVVPVAWYAINRWLESFAYKITVNPLLFIGAGLIIAIIAWLSIAYQSIKAAVINPTETLRNE
jgi:putative ABC transport system permease protein